MTLKLEDLAIRCPRCAGSGFLQDWRWAQWWSENEGPPPPGHRLLSVHEEIPCSECGEIGLIPTAEGQAILEFLNRFRGRR